MGGLTSWFSRKADQRLRLSQSKILYQNQAAIEYLLADVRALQEAGRIGPGTAEKLKQLDDTVAVAIFDLAAEMALPEGRSREQLEINKSLKDLYGRFLEGKRQGRQQRGAPAGDLIEFTERFRSALGWESLSEVEWKRMIDRALRE